MPTLQTKLSTLAQNKAQVSSIKVLKKLGVETISDLLYYLPYRYVDFSKFYKIKDVKIDEIATLKVKIKSIGSRFSFTSRKSLCEAVVSDDTGSLKVTWFNQGYLAKTLKVGQEIFLSGKIQNYKGLSLINPVHEIVSGQSVHTGRIVPIYHLKDGLYHKTLRTLVNNFLPIAENLEEIIPQKILRKFELLRINDAIPEIHFPSNNNLLEQAKKRVIFEELLIQQLAVQKHKIILNSQIAETIPANVELVKKFLKTLPFQLTNSQKKALWEIMQDMSSGKPMNRLLEGDVGSGKTLVALIASLLCSEINLQTAILAPTEILARQHFETFSKFLNPYYKDLVSLHTQNFHIQNGENVSKAEIIKNITDGKNKIIIGTHALLSNIEFKNLRLVIVDEQHRFGVKQRALLIKNSLNNQNLIPHLLSMSATPIPRTLALSFYGDLAISPMKNIPSGRQAIITKIIDSKTRSQTYEFIKNEIKKGRQIFIVTPRVEESDSSTVKSAKAEAQWLQNEVFKTYKVGLVHGKLKGAEKENIMNQFYNKKLDILVATSVIEIGIDVPNASVIVIENAENFGLAQLHQLRGRVGRGSHQSYCFLFSESQNEESLNRLKEFSKISDGLKLAELDLKKRGFGSLFGEEQTGFDFKFSNYFSIEVLKEAKMAASEILQEDVNLNKYDQLKSKVEPLLEKIHLE